MSRFMFNTLILLLSLSLNSCKWFESKEAITERIIKQDMETIDWNQIDRYPLFPSCDESLSMQNQQSCFAFELQAVFRGIIDEIKLDYPKELTALEAVELEVLATGSITLIKINYKDNKRRNKLDSILQRAVTQLDPLIPAIKRGVPVSVTYRMPFNIAVKE